MPPIASAEILSFSHDPHHLSPHLGLYFVRSSCSPLVKCTVVGSSRSARSVSPSLALVKLDFVLLSNGPRTSTTTSPGRRGLPDENEVERLRAFGCQVSQVQPPRD